MKHEAKTTEPKPRRPSVFIDQDVHVKFKTFCAERGMKINAQATAAIRIAMDLEKQAERDGRKDSPLFRAMEINN